MECQWRSEDEAVVIAQASKSDIFVQSVFLLATTFAHQHFAANAIESLERLSIKNHLIVTPDHSMLSECLKNKWACVLGPQETTHPSSRVDNSHSRRLTPSTIATPTTASSTTNALEQHSQGYNR